MTASPGAVILHVDDYPAGRHWVSQVLRRHGFAVVEATNGADALRLVHDQPDLVLLDVNLPDMHGFEVCRQIKADPASAGIPVLHLSSTAVEARDQVAGLQSGADGYLAAPVDPDVLVATIQAFVRARRAERVLRVQHAVARALAEAAGQDEVGPAILRAIGETMAWTWGALWEVDRPADLLRCTQTWQAPGVDLTDFATVSRNLTFALGVGLAGQVWSSGAPRWVADVRQESGFVRREVADRAGLRGACWFPVTDGAAILGVLEFFARAIAPPDDALIAAMAALGSQMGQVLQRKRAEATVRRERDFSDALLDTVGSLVLVLDRTGRIVRFNRACEMTTGYASAEVMGRPIWDTLLPAAEAEAVRGVFDRLLAGDFPNQFENHWVTRDGQHRLIAWTNTALLDSAGAVAYVIPTGIDVTEQRRSEMALRESEERFRATFDQSAVGIAHIRPDGRWLRMNQCLCDFLGYSREDLVDLTFQDVTHPEDLPADLALLERLLAGEIDSYVLEKRYIRRDRTIVWGHLTRSVVRDRTGAASYFISVVQDISDRVQAQTRLGARERQQAAAAALGQRALAVDDLAPLLQEAAARVADTMGVEYAVVLELQADGSALGVQAGVGWRDGLVGEAVVDAGGDSEVAYTLRSAEPVIVADLSRDQRFDGSPLLREHGIVAGISVVVAGRDRTFGILGAYTRERRTFTTDEVIFLQTIANVLGIAIERTQAEADRAESLAREEAARAQAEVEARYRGLLEAAPDAIVTVGADGAIALLNSQAEAMFGYRREELIGQPIEVLLPERFRERHVGYRTAYATKPHTRPMGVGYELYSRRKDGSEFPVEISLSPLKSAGGLLITSVIRDVSERKRAEAEREGLLIRAQTARAEVESAHRRVSFLADASRILSGSLDHEVTLETLARLAIPSFADMCQVDLIDSDGTVRRAIGAHVEASKEELLHQMQRLYPYDRRSPHPVLTVLETGQAAYFAGAPDSIVVSGARDATHLAMLRELAPRSIIIVPLVSRQNILGVISFAWCQPGRRYWPEDLALAEELARRAALAVDHARLYQLAQSAQSEAERRAAQMAEMNHLIAHDVRQPITIARIHSTLLKTAAERGDFDRVVVGAQAIDVATRRLDAMLRDLVDSAQLESGRVRIERELIELSTFLSETLQRLGGTLDVQRVRMEVREPVITSADPNRLERILGNLISNALKYGDSSSEVVVGVYRGEDEVLLLVADQGPGIAPEDLPHLFERGFRTAESAGKAEGLGLGLYITRMLVEAHGGRIWAESELGTGTTFYVALPHREVRETVRV
jgi:PAS domain S-box-containing protein